MKDWILVVDDVSLNLKIASDILKTGDMEVSCAKSGMEAVEFLKNNHPDLILLDIHMPQMDGFETMELIRQNPDTAKIPIIFLTADDDSVMETKGLKLGAMDFIKKPFVPDVLLIRVRHTIDLIRLQTDLSSEVAKKTQEVQEQNEQIRRLFMQLVTALSGAIDAKDTYTNGHSKRVAEYAQKLAGEMGMSAMEQYEIYVMGMLHDVGKIGVPDSIINKTSRLTDEEYQEIKRHSALGEGILKYITEFPKMVIGSRWHHERYDGKGYPDGLAGEDIPLEARIIAVADAYDAMSSKRSYRGILPQEVIRKELEDGSGTQFDPAIARCMMAMIDRDTEYTMQEK